MILRLLANRGQQMTGSWNGTLIENNIWIDCERLLKLRKYAKILFKHLKSRKSLIYFLFVASAKKLAGYLPGPYLLRTCSVPTLTLLKIFKFVEGNGLFD